MKETSLQDLFRSADERFRAGKFAEADNIGRQILQQHPDNPQALNLLCVLARQQGNIAGAIEIATRAARIHPRIAEFHANLGEFSRLTGNFPQAITSFQRAIELKPQEPTFHNSLATALCESHRHAEAIPIYQRTIQLKPDYAEAYNNLAGALRELGRIDEADAAVGAAIKFNPQNARAYFNRAIVRTDQERFPEAIESYKNAIEIDPNYSIAHWSLGTLHLLLGDMTSGWREYQWRPSLASRFARPPWKGEDLRGKTILLHAEQGLGDTIQFVRYIPMLVENGANVWLACQTELNALLGDTLQVLRPGQTIPQYDYHCSLLNLPMMFGTTAENIPAAIPYIKATQKQNKSAKFSVGLVWAGSKDHKDDARRSIRFEQLSPILHVPGVEFFSLQKSASSSQAAGSGITDLTAELSDFRDTAAIIANLDLVITVDTAVAHLAGAMGKPVWVLLARIPDWRWMLQRSDSPWYPTMRLFRQQRRGDWNSPIALAVHELAKLAAPAFDPRTPPV
jgi:tetratricopeptide (TPR) repeat protein